MGEKKNMGKDKDPRFYIANVAASALLVAGIGYITRANLNASKKASDKASSCPVTDGDKDALCGALSVGAAVAVMDRVPGAGLAGMAAAAAPFALLDEKSRCTGLCAMSGVLCAYLFAEK